MVRGYKNISRKAVVLSALLFAVMFTASARAQNDPELEGAKEGKPKLVPNLTVNVVLNSALSEEETLYYSKVAEKLLTHLPRNLTVEDLIEEGKKQDPAYDHLNVVTYLPSLADQDNGLDKSIRYFKVKFDFAKDGNQMPVTMQMNRVTANEQPEEDIAEDSVKIAQPKLPEVEGKAPVVVAKKEKQQTKQAKEVSAAGNKSPPQKADSKAKKPSPKKSEPLRVRLAYKADALETPSGERSKLLEFIEEVKEMPDVVGYHIIARTNPGPFGSLEGLGEERLKVLSGFMRQQNLNIHRDIVTAIYAFTHSAQYMEIEVIRGEDAS